ncbi:MULTISPECIES: SRPBCC family protein [Streptomyces]|nr:SRPBCC family protein [Streptomyces spororaveus]
MSVGNVVIHRRLPDVIPRGIAAHLACAPLPFGVGVTVTRPAQTPPSGSPRHAGRAQGIVGVASAPLVGAAPPPRVPSFVEYRGTSGPRWLAGRRPRNGRQRDGLASAIRGAGVPGPCAATVVLRRTAGGATGRGLQGARNEARRLAPLVPGVRLRGVRGGPPYGVGTARRLRLVGGMRALETVLVWDPARCFAYRVEEAGVPGVRAMMEEWRLAPSPYGGTTLHWTIALDVRQPVRPLWRAANPLLAGVLRRAARRLDLRIASAAVHG